jgi:ABC-type multidrug transport system ATPase subunit
MRIELDGVAFSYPGGIVGLEPTTALLDGQLIGVLGHNGSGKSTLIGLLAGTLAPTAGTVHLDGQPVTARRRVSFFPQEVPRFPLAQTPRQTLANSLVLARVTDPGGLEEMAGKLLELVGLTRVADRPVATFSGGMKQKVRIAQALVHNPSVLVLDEPTTGLDVEERLSIVRLLHRLQDRMPVVFSTHDCADVAAICDVVAILAQGRLAGAASPEQLANQVAGLVWEWVIPDLSYLPNAGMYITRLHRSTEGIRVRAVGASPPGGAVSVTPTVEDAYVKLTRAMRESR